MKSLLTSIPHP